MYKLPIFFLFISLNLFAQTKFKSTKYNYSFIFPDGWNIKSKIYTPDVDAKIVDGKGNSLIVTVKEYSTPAHQTARQELEILSNSEIEEQFDAIYGKTSIIKRGSVIIGSREFYYIHMLTPFTNGLQLYHKTFSYNWGKKTLTIDACSIETYLDETTPAFAIMLNTFNF